MSVLVILARWVGVVEDTIEGVVHKLVYTFLPRAKHGVGSRVGLLPLEGSVVNIFVNLQNGVLGNSRVRLHLGSTDGHTEANFQHVTSGARHLISKCVHVGGFPSFHNGVTING